DSECRGAGADECRGELGPACFRRLSAASGRSLCGASSGERAREDGLKISGTQHLAVPAEEAYRMMQDPEVLARAIPGCESLEKIGENEYKMKMKMALASISGAFEGKVRITDQVPPTSFRLIVEGAGKIGFV